MNVKKIMYVVALVLIGSITATADESYSDTLKRFIDVSGQRHQINLAMKKRAEQLHPVFKENIAILLRKLNKNITENQINTATTDLLDQFLSSFDAEYINLTKDQYKKKFTQRELQELITLMENPVYQDYSEKTRQLSIILQNSGPDYGRKILPTLLRSLYDKYK